MHFVRETLRLKAEGLSDRAVARSTVSDYPGGCGPPEVAHLNGPRSARAHCSKVSILFAPFSSRRGQPDADRGSTADADLQTG
jgi:hypothetical protein